MPKLKKILITALVTLPFLWVVGFCLFLVRVSQVPPPPHPEEHQAHVAVVFTGDQDRMDKALGLLDEAHIDKLFISGVHSDVTHNDIYAVSQLESVKWPKNLHSVHLGKQATNTYGNALETAEWVKAQKIDRFYLITSTYHMPRSLLLTSWMMPHVTVIPWAIELSSPPQDTFGWLRRIRIIVLEYVKLSKMFLDGTYIRAWMAVES